MSNALNRRLLGFTLIELLVAMSIGLIIVNVAFTALYFTRKFVRKGEVIGSKNDAMQSMMLWCLTKTVSGSDTDVTDSGDNNGYPSDYQYRQVRGRLTALPAGAYSAPDARPGKWYMAEAIQYDKSNLQTPVDTTLRPYEIVIGRLYFAAPNTP